ncbi:DUF1553 domain-containing protein [Bythopirellula polymerisocia]|nr:DUF1553 domain-containing protein [Bythopirellula polymerisocia]
MWTLKHGFRKWSLLGWAALICYPALCLGFESNRPISFAHDVRPILSEHCYHCHGPDANTREADLRLDSQDAFLDSEESVGIVVAGNPNESELFLRIVSTDEDMQMPPAEANRPLSAKQIETIRRWIDEGAVWQQHWSFTKPERPQLRTSRDDGWSKNEIDWFILQRLQQEGLTPSPEADKQTLIRRVTLDLTGLPPTPEEVDCFLADDRPNAYELLVERLLHSPRYGEQMAASWLDAARYADSYGYQDDGETSMWRWRDWVIEAFNDNMPFDQFTIEQLAGDLLPNPTFEQRIATGFNRNHRHNSEGGAIPEEFRVEYVVDRVNTTCTVWLGLTLGCARCHDHKYDPITQKEFYQLFAFFNNVPEDGRARKVGNTPPLMTAPTRAQLNRQQELEMQLEVAQLQLEGLEPQFLADFDQWQRNADVTTISDLQGVTHDLDIYFKLDGNLAESVSGDSFGNFKNGAATFVTGQLGQAAWLDGKKTIVVGDVGSFSDDNRVTISAWIRPSDCNGALLSKMENPDDPQEEGYSVLLREGKIRVHFTSQWFDDAIRIQTETSVPLDQWTHVAVTYDGLSLAQGIRVYFNGKRQPIDIEFDSLFQGFGNHGPLRLGTAGDPESQFQGAIDDVRIYGEQLSDSELKLLAVKESVSDILQILESDRTENQKHKLRTYFTDRVASKEYRQAAALATRLRQELDEHRRGFPTLMIMEDLAERKPTFLLNRGQYDAPGEEVEPEIPAVFNGLAEGLPHNRLGLARWLLDPDNPLTARVAVNRLWQMSFDLGLVKTVEDFGVQGEGPSHPDLLDWLATELMNNGWDLQAIRRLIVTSATYRQQSQATPELVAADPENRLLARGPRFRLAAEEIRDAALFASGLLVEQLGGPSVKPYQPPDLWEEIADDEYVQDSGEKLYRRSLYLFWKRTVTHPLMTALDAPSREICTVREERTNTPMQALALLNEEGLVEAARVLAERVLTGGHDSSADRLESAFRLVTSRYPKPQELSVMQQSLETHLAHFTKHPQEAKQLAAVGEHLPATQLDAVEVAAYTAVANMLLNLDEVVTQH